MKITLYPKYLIRSLFVHGKRDFFEAGYKLLYPECGKCGMTPWQHYVIEGKRKGFDNGNHPSDAVFFDEGYLLEYPDVKEAGVDPWHHYVEKGRAEGRDNGLHPGEQRFFPDGYLRMYPEVARSGMDPWRHYVTKGRKEGRHIRRIATFREYTDWILELNSDKSCFVQDDGRSYIRKENDPKIFAYYLPQFHAIPINDKNYGKGFTEWTNVTRATPLFLGHYQPKVPYDLGFYSLDHAEVMERQAALAKQYGIYGFCFYFYWFGGDKVLEKPLRLFLNSKIDLKFHLMWANENWSRLWDGGNNEIILEQKKVDTSMADRFYRDILPYIKDERYEKIDNKPVFAIYRPNFFDPALFRDFLSQLNLLARRDGFDGFYFLGTNYRSFNEPEKYGLEGIIEFPPHGLWDIQDYPDADMFNLKTSIGIIDLHKWIQNQSYIDNQTFRVFKGCFPHWDNSPRKAYSYGSVFLMDNDDFYNWLTGIIHWTRKHHSLREQYVYINAWNEWGEGAYLEPDVRYGYASLNCVRKALEDSRIS